MLLPLQVPSECSEMRPTMCMETKFGKLGVVRSRAEASTILGCRRLCVMDYNSGLNFLVDTGANISVLPVPKISKFIKNPNYKLYAANGTEIATFGEKTLVLDLKLRRAFRWNFVLADVKQAILGADFLTSNNLLVDMGERKLIDKVTDLNVLACIVVSNQPSLHTVDVSHPYRDLLAQYPDITKPASFKEVSSHNVLHYIEIHVYNFNLNHIARHTCTYYEYVGQILT